VQINILEISLINEEDMLNTMKNNQEIRRDELCEKALKVFARYGYRKTTLDDIAKEANVSKGTIYGYFKNKEDVYTQTVTLAGSKWINWLQDCIKDKSLAMDKFSTLLKEALLYLSSNADFQKVLQDNPQAFPIVSHSPFLEQEVSAKQILRSVLEQGVQEGVFRPMDFDKMEKVLFSIYRMLVVWKYVTPNEFFDDSMVDDTIDLMINGIGSKTHPTAR
jgi:AcrR family transcriptional regulator